MMTLVTIGVISFVGNGLVIAVISRSHRVQWVTNLFVAHLAAVNLAVPLISVPVYFYWSLHRKWMLGDTSCKIVQFSHLLNAGVSVCMLACIAYDRYYVVVHPLTLHLRRTQTFHLIMFIWIFIIFTCTPALYFYKLQNTKCGIVCGTNYDSKSSWGGFFISFSLLAFFLPLFVLLVLYALIIKTIQERDKFSKVQAPQMSIINSFERNSDESRKYLQTPLGKVPKTKRKVVKMMIIQSVVFIICWVPYFIKEYSKLWPDSKAGDKTRDSPVFLWMCFSNASINPVLYTILNSNFRRGCRHLFSLHISEPYTLQALQRRHRVGIAESYHLDSEDEGQNRNSQWKQQGNGKVPNRLDSTSDNLEDLSCSHEENKKHAKMFQVSKNSGIDAWS